MRRTRPLVSTLALAIVLAAESLSGQGPARRFTVGGSPLVTLDFAATPVGDVPANIQVLNGTLEVVDFLGQRMLRASARSMFLVPLPSVLPAEFTLEFDIVPKTCCNPEDLAIEGTRAIDQGEGSAHILWHREHIQVVGGGGSYDSPMPPALAAAIPGELTHVALVMSGDQLKLYTNGRLTTTLTRKFVRSRVLRVFLGGQNDGDQAVYLAGMRVISGAVAVTPTAPASGGGAPAEGAASPPASDKPSATPPADTASRDAKSQMPGPAYLYAAAVGPGRGISLNWGRVAGAVRYHVYRQPLSWEGPWDRAPFIVMLTPGADGTVISDSAGGLIGNDPHLVAGERMQYRVEAAFADGTTSAFSPWVNDITVKNNADRSPKNLQVTFTPNPAGGSVAVWQWDRLAYVYGYGIALNIGVPPGQKQVRDFLVFQQNDTATAAQFSYGVPSGAIISFCVGPHREDHPVHGNAVPMTPLGLITLLQRSCFVSLVP